jgi:hypothetical protein
MDMNMEILSSYAPHWISLSASASEGLPQDLGFVEGLFSGDSKCFRVEVERGRFQRFAEAPQSFLMLIRAKESIGGPCAGRFALHFLASTYHKPKLLITAISPLFSDHRKCFDMLFIY